LVSVVLVALAVWSASIVVSFPIQCRTPLVVCVCVPIVADSIWFQIRIGLPACVVAIVARISVWLVATTVASFRWIVVVAFAFLLVSVCAAVGTVLAAVGMLVFGFWLLRFHLGVAFASVDDLAAVDGWQRQPADGDCCYDYS